MRLTRHFTKTTLLLTALAGISPAVAQEPPVPPNRPAAENDGLKMFTGNCPSRCHHPFTKSARVCSES